MKEKHEMRKSAVMTVICGVLLMAIVTSGCGLKGEITEVPAQFFKGKTIDLVTNEEAGSFSDLLARVIMLHLAQDTGATVIVSNRRGAGGLEGLNYLYGAKPDGLTLGMASTIKAVANKVLGEPAASYEMERFSYIMSIGLRPNYFFVSPEGPCQSIADLQAAKDLKIGAGSASGYISLAGLTIIKVLGLDARVITGFSGAAERALAVKRGEIIGSISNMSAATSFIESGMYKPLFTLATQRDPLTPDVPAITELVNLTDEDLALVKLWEKTLVASSLFAGPPDLTEDRLEFLRDLADRWVKDEGFRKEIDAVSGYELKDKEYTNGEEVTESMEEMAANLGNFQAIFAQLIEKYRD
jgi:tripartite-type tricarboxylate transporter receptor subunit TctC